jgi:hypothetical protein
MTDETTTEAPELMVSFIGTRKKGEGRQLAYQVNDSVFFVDVDTKAYLAGERIVRKAAEAVELHAKAVTQGLI